MQDCVYLINIHSLQNFWLGFTNYWFTVYIWISHNKGSQFMLVCINHLFVSITTAHNVLLGLKHRLVLCLTLTVWISCGSQFTYLNLMICSRKIRFIAIFGSQISYGFRINHGSHSLSGFQKDLGHNKLLGFVRILVRN